MRSTGVVVVTEGEAMGIGWSVGGRRDVRRDLGDSAGFDYVKMRSSDLFTSNKYGWSKGHVLQDL